MPFWTYMLRCSDGRYYVGHTDALEMRIASHQAGRGSDFTARRQPVALAWSQDFPTRIEALEAERRIKGWTRGKKAALIAGDWQRLRDLAVSRGTRPSTSIRTNGAIGAAGPSPFVPSDVDGLAAGDAA